MKITFSWCLVTALITSLASATWGASLATDTSALVKGSVAFTGQPKWSGYVDYAVYAPGVYSGNHVDKSTNYIYAYQVFNNAASTAALSSFTVGLLENAGAANPTYDASTGISGGKASLASSLIGTPPASVFWMLDSVAASEYSTVLLFSSPYSYTFDSATVADGGQGVTQSLPTPVPEPATLALIAMGGLAVMHRRR